MPRPKSRKLEPAARWTIGMFDGLTEDEKAERARREELELDAPPAGRPFSRRDAAARGKAMAGAPPRQILAADVKIEPCNNGTLVLVFVGASSGGVVSKYACTYVTPEQLDKLCSLWQEQRTPRAG